MPTIVNRAELSNGAVRVVIGSVQFDRTSGELKSGTIVRSLEPKAGAVLAVLADAKGEVVSRSELLDGCWGEGVGSDEVLTQAVSQIRRAFATLGHSSEVIQTRPKRGYRLADAPALPPVRSAPARPSKAVLGVSICLIVILLAGWFNFPYAPRHLVWHGALSYTPAAEDLTQHP
jgi:DNA-binding winged helix-turn-helix (wHTH) protein